MCNQIDQIPSLFQLPSKQGSTTAERYLRDIHLQGAGETMQIIRKVKPVIIEINWHCHENRHVAGVKYRQQHSSANPVLTLMEKYTYLDFLQSAYYYSIEWTTMCPKRCCKCSLCWFVRLFVCFKNGTQDFYAGDHQPPPATYSNIRSNIFEILTFMSNDYACLYNTVLQQLVTLT